MKLMTGLLFGVVGYSAWKLSEPGPGESGELNARLERLKIQWRKAADQGRMAGDAKRQQMEREFGAVFQQPR
jgi:hypothetical protein